MNGINLGRIYANDVAIDNVGNETLGFATVDNTTHVFILTQEKDGLYFWTSECDSSFIQKDPKEALEIFHLEWTNEGWSEGPFSDVPSIMKAIDSSDDMDKTSTSDELNGKIRTFLYFAHRLYVHHKYYVTFRIETQQTVEVESCDIESAINQSYKAFIEANMDCLDDIADYELITVKDEDGNIVWEKLNNMRER